MMRFNDLLRAARERPEDDAPRLALAGWLERSGEPERAELVRLQCQLARLPKVARGRKKLADREALLLRRHGGRWRGPLPSPRAPWRFARGLLEVTLTTDRFLRDPAAWLSLPWLGEVRLSDAYVPEPAWLLAGSRQAMRQGDPLDACPPDPDRVCVLSDGYMYSRGRPGYEMLLSGALDAPALEAREGVRCGRVWVLIDHRLRGAGPGVGEPAGRHYGTCFGNAWAYPTFVGGLEDLARLGHEPAGRLAAVWRKVRARSALPLVSGAT